MAESEKVFEMKFEEKTNVIGDMEEKLIDLDEKEESKTEDTSLSRVLQEYEKTMSGCITQIDKLKEKMDTADAEKLQIIRERDQALEDLRNVESAFSDVHRKYERAKGLLENGRKNEEILTKRDQEMTLKIANRDARIEEMKLQTQKAMEGLHTQCQTKIKEMEGESTRNKVLLRKSELKVETLQIDLEQKQREIHKLTGLFDDMINGGVH